MKNEKVELTDGQRKYLINFISKGVRKVRALRRAKTLLLLDEGTIEQKHIAAQLDCSEDTVTRTIKRFHITALACAKEGPNGNQPLDPAPDCRQPRRTGTR